MRGHFQGHELGVAEPPQGDGHGPREGGLATCPLNRDNPRHHRRPDGVHGQHQRNPQRLDLDHPELLPPGCYATRIGTRDFKWTQPGLDQEQRITCDLRYDEDNSDSGELWVPGRPLFPAAMAEHLGFTGPQPDHHRFAGALTPEAR